MNTRLKIICVLFALAYIFIIGETIGYNVASAFKMEQGTTDAYEMGYNYGKLVKEGRAPESMIWGMMMPAIGLLLICVAILGLFIYIPILTYKVIDSIVKDNIFDPKNIKRIRRIGYALLLAFALAIILYPLTGYLNEIVSVVTDSREIGSVRDDYSLLLFGLLTLLFAEILKISHTMKEEQDLTV